MLDFLWLALAAGCGVALMTGPLGAFVVWRRLAYFGDTLAHGALIGAARGLMLSVNPQVAIVASSVVLALLLLLLQKRVGVSTDTLLGILSHTALAAGLVCVHWLSDARVDLYGYLFGDLLTVTPADLGAILVVAVIVVGTLLVFWRPLLNATLDEALARAEGVATEKLRVLLLVLVALVIAFAMKVVGLLLITALLIIPAATSRRLSRNPETMAAGATVIGIIAVMAGLAFSYYLDTPAGPSIVLAASAQFVLSQGLARRT